MRAISAHAVADPFGAFMKNSTVIDSISFSRRTLRPNVDLPSAPENFMDCELEELSIVPSPSVIVPFPQTVLLNWALLAILPSGISSGLGLTFISPSNDIHARTGASAVVP